jgi:hypothetical protein
MSVLAADLVVVEDDVVVVEAADVEDGVGGKLVDLLTVDNEVNL